MRVKDTDRFIRIQKQGAGFGAAFEIWVDKATGVNYAVWASGYAGGMTVMLDADGKPIVTELDDYGRVK